MASTRAVAGMGSWVQLAFPNDPSNQKSTDWVAWGLPRKIKKLVTDSKRAESTTPHKINWVGASCWLLLEMRKTVAMAARAPSTLPTEIAQMPSEAKAPNSRTAVAPTLAPEDTPRRNGSASALRTRAWTTVPAVVQRRADHRREQYPGQANVPDDLVSHRVVRMAGDMVHDDLPHHAGLSETDPMPTPRVTVVASSRVHPTNTTHSGRRSRRRRAARAGALPPPDPPTRVASCSRPTVARSATRGVTPRGWEPGHHPQASGVFRRTTRDAGDQRHDREVRHEPPFLRELFRRRRAGDRTRPTKGTTVAGQRRILTGLRCICTTSVLDRGRVTVGPGKPAVKYQQMRRYRLVCQHGQVHRVPADRASRRILDGERVCRRSTPWATPMRSHSGPIGSGSSATPVGWASCCASPEPDRSA